MAKLTAIAIANMKPPAARKELPDDLVKGLYLVLQPSGKRGWALRWRHEGTPTKLVLDTPCPAYQASGRDGRKEYVEAVGRALVAARKEAQPKLLAIAEGKNPAAEKRDAKRAAPPAPKREADTIEKVAADFQKRHIDKKSPRTATEYKRQLGLLKERWAGRLMTDIGRRDLLDVLDELVDAGKPVAADRTRALAHKLGAWCVARGVLPANPFTGVERPAGTKPRDRVLTDDELRLVWRAAGEMGEVVGPWLRLLMLTGVRREEAATMRRQDVDAEHKVWRIPAAKGDVPHLVPLSQAALDIIEAMPKLKGPYVFSTTGGERPISGYSQMKARLDNKIAAVLAEQAKKSKAEPVSMPHFTIHDLRRTVRTNLSRIGIQPHVAELVLGHKIQGIQAVYDIWQYEPEKRHALERWAAFLAELLEPRPDKVVPIKAVNE